MNPTAAKIIADNMLKGIFDVLDAMLSKSYSTSQEGPETLDIDTLTALLIQHGLCFEARVGNGMGKVALLLSNDVGAELVSGVEGGYEELAKQCMEGGLRTLLETCGKPAVSPEEIIVLEDAGASIEGDVDYFGDGAGVVMFTFNEADGDPIEAAILYSAPLESVASEDGSAGGGGDASVDPAISRDEMNDILGNFDAADEVAHAAMGEIPQAAPPMGASQDNIERILDIRLLATARLGRVELPIGEILNFGPGSIIEVGHLVDEPIELLINDKLIAKGDVVVVDEKFGLRITEIISPEERIESLS